MNTPILDTGITVGNFKVKNRLVMPPMQTDRTRFGHATEEMIKYYGDRARYSRPGIVITEHCYITKGGRVYDQLSIADDSTIDDHYRIADIIHDGGSLAICQINQAGSKSLPDGSYRGEPVAGVSEIKKDSRVSASNVNTPSNLEDPAPRPLEINEILKIEKLFTEAAVRAVKAGYDGVEIHAAHSYLLNQFYSPLTNHRTDEYGGSLENRMRIIIETLEAVKAAVGDYAIVAVRLGGADYMEGGATEEDAVKAAVMLENAGADLIDITGGMCRFIRPDHKEPGYFRSMSGKVKEAVSVPVILTGGVTKLEEAEELIGSGAADLVGVGRAILKDAAWGRRESAK